MISPKIIWTEGMFLRPQHFQYLEQHLSSQAQWRQTAAHTNFWGFHELELDQSALGLGLIQVSRASGVLPDGTAFSFSAAHAPAPLVIPADTYDQRVYLALPRLRAEGSEVAFDDGANQSAARYRVIESELADRCDHDNAPALVQQGLLRWQLLLEHQIDGDWVALPLALVREKKAESAIVLEPEYIAPVLHYSLSPALHHYTKELYGLLTARCELLAQRMRQLGSLMAGDMAELMALQSLNAYRNRVWGLLQLPRQHPEQWYVLMLEVLGAVSTHSQQEKQPDTWPPYVHDDLQQSFRPLMEQLRVALNTILEQVAIRIELQDRGQGVRLGQVPDAQLLQHAQFVLAIRADLPEEQIRQHFPAQVKLGPANRIHDLVHLQLPGVMLRSLSYVPRELPLHSGFVYFGLEQHGDMWRQLQQQGSLALHLAGEFPGLELECWAIKQGQDKR